MEERSNNSKVKYFYFLAGFCLATLLTIIYSGTKHSSWSKTADFKPSSLLQTVQPVPNQGITDGFSAQPQAYTHSDGESKDWPPFEVLPKIEHYRAPPLFDGTYRDHPDDIELLAEMTNRRTRDNYTYCSGTAPFVGPYPYVTKTKNPCWYNGDTLQCLPYFFLAGFSKCGTSDLFNRISHHPQVISSKKEKHWFDYIRYFKGKESIECYSSMFVKTAKAINRDVIDNGYSSIITGDGTPCYAWFSFYWRCYEGNEGLDAPKFTNADVIYRMNPRAKIIILLRDPVSRLYSRYLTRIGKIEHEAYKKPSPAAFHSLVVNAISVFNKCVDRWSVRHCAFNGTLYTQMALRLQEGLYSVFLKDWLRVFPKEQIYVIRFEDYVKDLPGFLKKTFDFLDLDQLPAWTLEKIVTFKKRNKGRYYFLGQMFNTTRKLLEKFYIPFNDDLPSLLGENSIHWSYT